MGRDCVTAAGCSLKAALATGLPSGSFGSTATTIVARKRREAEAAADADAEADADAYYYSSVAGHGQAYSTFVDDHPLVAYSHPLGYNYGLPYGYNYGLNYAAAPLVHHVAPVVETVSKPVTYTHLGAHPIQPTTVIQTESNLVGR